MHIVTLYRPEYWLDMELSQLASLPLLKRVRKELEKNKSEVGQKNDLKSKTKIMGGRKIINFGNEHYQYRETWIPTDKLVQCLKEFDVRLIYTEEEGSQARYKFEFRPDWAKTPSPLDKVMTDKLFQNIRDKEKVSIRQLWSNPVAARFGTLPLEMPEEIAKKTANLMLGPLYDNDSRRADLDFENKNKIWCLVYFDYSSWTFLTSFFSRICSIFSRKNI